MKLPREASYHTRPLRSGAAILTSQDRPALPTNSYLNEFLKLLRRNKNWVCRTTVGEELSFYMLKTEICFRMKFKRPCRMQIVILIRRQRDSILNH